LMPTDLVELERVITESGVRTDVKKAAYLLK
jgi:hypothetical protein